MTGVMLILTSVESMQEVVKNLVKSWKADAA